MAPAPHADLLVLVELPALGVNTNIKFNVNSTNLERVAGVLSETLSDLAVDLENDLLLNDVEGSDLKIEHLRKSAAGQLTAWEQRLVEAAETKAKGERAVHHLKNMREAYYKELSNCRDQLYMKKRAEEEGKDFTPNNVVHFDPTEYVADDEMSELLRQKISLMQQEHQHEIRELHTRNATLVEMVKSKGMHLAAKEKYLAQVIDERTKSKDDPCKEQELMSPTRTEASTRVDTTMSEGDMEFTQVSFGSMPDTRPFSPASSVVPASKVRTKVADAGVNTETKEMRSTACQCEVDGTLLDKAAELVAAKTESTWQHLLVGDSDSDDDEPDVSSRRVNQDAVKSKGVGGRVGKEVDEDSELGEDSMDGLPAMDKRDANSNDFKPSAQGRMSEGAMQVMQLFVEEARAVRAALKDASTQVEDDLDANNGVGLARKDSATDAGEDSDSSESDSERLSVSSYAPSAVGASARTEKMSVEQILMRRNIRCNASADPLPQQAAQVVVTTPTGAKPGWRRPVPRVLTDPGASSEDTNRATQPIEVHASKTSPAANDGARPGRAPSKLGVPNARRNSTGGLSGMRSPSPCSGQDRSTLPTPSPTACREPSPNFGTQSPSAGALPRMASKSGVSCINFGDVIVKGASPPEDDDAARGAKPAKPTPSRPTSSRPTQDHAAVVVMTPDMPEGAPSSSRRTSDGAAGARRTSDNSSSRRTSDGAAPVQRGGPQQKPSRSQGATHVNKWRIRSDSEDTVGGSSSTLGSEKGDDERTSWRSPKPQCASRCASRSMELPPDADFEREKVKMTARSMDLPDDCGVSMRISSKGGPVNLKGKQTLPPLSTPKSG